MWPSPSYSSTRERTIPGRQHTAIGGLRMWDDQVGPFTGQFRLVRYDRRGHGQSGVPPGPYTMERLGKDVLSILNALGIQKTSWCGLSMGGMVGQWLGANAPGRIERLVLTNTSSYFPDKSVWNERLRLVREKGIAAFAPANMERWFTKAFRERAPDVVARVQQMFAATPLEGYLACGAAVRDMDHRKSCRASEPPPSSSPESTTRRRLRRQTSISARASQGRNSHCLMPLTCPTSSNRRHTPRPSWIFCSGDDPGARESGDHAATACALACAFKGGATAAQRGPASSTCLSITMRIIALESSRN